MNRLLVSRQSLWYGIPHSVYVSSSPLDSSVDTDTGSVWPRYKPQKDKHAVLDALASTVKPISPPLIFGHGPNDPYFVHFSRTSLLQYAQHWLAGKKAAEFVIDRTPSLFPGFRALPEVVPDPEPPPSSEPTLERLDYLVRLGMAEEAYSLYTTLKTEHSEVNIPVSLLDNLLEVMTHKCVGGEFILMPRKKRYNSQRDTKLQEEGESFMDTAYFTGAAKRWKKGGPCDQLFQEMKSSGVATAQSYNSMMLGKFRHDSLKEFSLLYGEALEMDIQPSLLIHNSYLKTVVFYFAALGETTDTRVSLVTRTIERMNREPVVLPDASTFTTLIRFSSFGSIVNRDLPTSYQLFREMLARDILPNLSHLTVVLKCNFTYLDELMAYVKSHPEILVLSTDPDQQAFLSTALEIAISKDKPQHVEYIYQLNKETSGLLDTQEPGVFRNYLNYKLGSWNVLQEPKRADEMYRVLNEYIQLTGYPCLPEIENSTKFFQIGRHDLYFKVLQTAFVVHDDSDRNILSSLIKMMSRFISEELLPNYSPGSAVYAETANFVWLLVGRFERSVIFGNNDEFTNLCRKALKLFETSDEVKYKRIAKWLASRNKERKRN